MNIQNQVGSQSNADGVFAYQRSGKNGDLIVSQLHGRRAEQTLRGNCFGIQGTAVTTTAAGAATFTGLCVGNPVGSGVNMVLNRLTVSQVAALTAATTIGLMYGPSTAAITASLTSIYNRLPGGADSAMVATAGQTITAPTAFRVFAGSGSGAITVPLIIPALDIDLDGELIIPPGYFVASYTSAVTTTALLFGFEWEEVTRV